MTRRHDYLGPSTRVHTRDHDTHPNDAKMLETLLGESVLPKLASPRLRERLGQMSRQFLSHVLHADLASAERLLREVFQSGVGFEDLALGIFLPAARSLGDMWDRDAIGFVDATLASGNLQRLLLNLADELPLPANPRGQGLVALVSPAPEEAHALGAVMAAAFLRRDGWSVETELQPTRMALCGRVASRHVDALGLSLAGRRGEKALQADVKAIRRSSINAAMALVVGGRLADEDPPLANRIGADAPIHDLGALSSRLVAMVAARNHAVGPSRNRPV